MIEGRLSLSLQSFQDLSIPVSWPLLLSGVSRGRTRRGQWPGIKPGQSGGEEGVKREHVGGGGWEVGFRRALDDKFSAIGSFDADSPPLPTCDQIEGRTCDTSLLRGAGRRRGKDREEMAAGGKKVGGKSREGVER